MKLHIFIITCLLSALSINAVQASDDPQNLIENCQELVGIYSKRDEKHFAAGLTTSLSEAFRAGSCKGVVDEYRRNFECDTDDWFSQAKTIADYSLSFGKHTTVDRLLEISCDH